MTIKGFVMTLGLGMAGGAAAAMVLPRQPQLRKAVSKAADAVETAAETAKNAMR